MLKSVEFSTLFAFVRNIRIYKNIKVKSQTKFFYNHTKEVHFNNPEIKKAFEEIVAKRKLIGNDITNLLVDYVDDPKEALRKDNTEIKSRVSDTLKKISNLELMAAELRKLMAEETLENKNSTLQINSKLPKNLL